MKASNTTHTWNTCANPKRTLPLIMLATLWPAVLLGQNIDLTTADAAVAYHNARFEQGKGTTSSGTGIFDPFYRVSAANLTDVSGVNTDMDGGSHEQFQTDKNGQWTTALLLSTVTQVELGGVKYRAFFLDINQVKNATVPYELQAIQLFIDNQKGLDCLIPGAPSSYSTVANATYCPSATTFDTAPLAKLIWDLDAGTRGNISVLLNYDLESGSGARDMRLLIEDSLFASQLPAGQNCDYGQPMSKCSTYVFLYSKFTPNDDGFEEWATAIQPFILLSKTINGSLTETTSWTIDKSVDPDSLALFDGDSAYVEYLIELNKTVQTGSELISGTVVIQVPSKLPDNDENAINAPIVGLADTFDVTHKITLAGCPAGLINSSMGAPYVVNAGTMVTCTYSYSPGSAETGVNVATALVLRQDNVTTNTYIAKDTLDSYVTSPSGDPDSVNVSDGALDFGPFSDDSSFTYTRGFECGGDEGDHQNIAVIDETGDADTASVHVDCYELAIEKSAQTTETENYTWDIAKTVQPDSAWKMFYGDSATSKFTINVTKSPAASSGFKVDGEIHVGNDTPLDAVIDTVIDAMTGPIDGVVSCGVTFPYTLVAGDTLDCTYVANLPNDDARTNTATATQQNYVYDKNGGATEDGTTDYSDDADVDFTSPIVETGLDSSATATDDLGTPGNAGDDSTWGFGASGQRMYEKGFTCDDEGKTTNWVYLVGDDTGAKLDSASAEVNVECYDIAVTKNATPAFERDWKWMIEKSADQDSLTLALGQTFQVNYDLDVSGVYKDTLFGVEGMIWVANLNPIEAEIADLGDVIQAGSFNGQPDCGTSFPATIAPGDSLVCSYGPVDLPNDSTRENKATAGLQNHAYHWQNAPVKTDTSDYDGTASVDFSGVIPSEIDECVDVNDPLGGGLLGTFCAEPGDQDTTFSFPYDIVVPDDPSGCGEFDVPNYADFLTNDTDATGEDSVTIHVTVPCPEGCTLTQGYWKTHNESFPGGAPPDSGWFEIGPLGELTTFFLSGDTWYGVFWTKPQGNFYYQLATQYMAAKLNSLNNGAGEPAEVTAAIAQAESLFAIITPASVPKGNVKKSQQALMDLMNSLHSILASFNEGSYEGFPHCDEDQTSSLTLQGVVAKADETPSTEAEATAESESGDVAAKGEVAEEIPTEFNIGNYPNPFNPTTTMLIELPEDAVVTITVFDALGRRVTSLVNEELKAGVHRVIWDAGNLPSGTYFYSLQSAQYNRTNKMLLLK